MIYVVNKKELKMIKIYLILSLIVFKINLAHSETLGNTPTLAETKAYILEMFIDGSCGTEGSFKGTTLHTIYYGRQQLIDFAKIEINENEVSNSKHLESKGYLNLNCIKEDCAITLVEKSPWAKDLAEMSPWTIDGPEIYDMKSFTEPHFYCNTFENVKLLKPALKHLLTFYPHRKALLK